MRILILANIDMGLYKFRKELLDELVKNHDVFICVPEGEYVKKMEEMGCQFIPCNVLDRRSTNPFKDLKLIRFYKKIMKKTSPDVVLTYTIKPNIYGGWVCRQQKIPYLSNITGLGTAIENGGILATISIILYKIGLKNASCVFFQNQNNQKLFIDKCVVKGKTRLIPGSGVNLEVHKFEKYPEESGNMRFLFVGRIMKDKGIEELLSAFKTLHSEDNRIVLDVVGFCDEDYIDELKQSESEGSIIFHGIQSEVHSFYAKCNCTVLPSYHEGMANVMLESSATGRPVVTTTVPGCIETFDEGITGFGCEAKSTESLLTALKKFLSQTHEEKVKMGANARQKMEREFDRQIVINAYNEEIQSCCISSRN